MAIILPERDNALGLGKCSKQGGIRTAACSVPKALALEAVYEGGTQRRHERNKDMYDKSAIAQRFYADVKPD